MIYINGVGRYAGLDSTGAVLDGNGNVVASPRAYSGIWYHGAATTLSIATQSVGVLVDKFTNIGDQDALGNVVASTGATSKFTIGANGAGLYDIVFQVSISVSGGAAKRIALIPRRTLATPIVINAATNATPIEITTASDHNLQTGNFCTISGCTGNTAANGEFYITKVNATKFTLQTIVASPANVAGNGVYDAGSGSLTHEFFGNMSLSTICTGTGLERGAATGRHTMAAGGVLELYVFNKDGSEDVIFSQLNFTMERIY